MSVTVSDILKLPSLRNAEVIAGKRGLSRIVSSISVLEAVDPSLLVDGLFRQGEFFGSEIVITGFLNCTEDVEKQYANIKRLAEGGEVGLILFYVGVYMPRVDKRLIDLANDLDFVLIQMPPYRNLRYGEVISDVMEYIFNDRSKNEFIASDILARVSRLPEHQRTISTVLRMISDDIMSSVILTDNSHNTLNIAPWPQSVEKELLSCLPRLYRSPEDTSILESFMPGCSVYSLPVIPDSDSPMRLYIIKGGGPLSRILRSQAADIVRICVNIWGKGHGAVAVRELIRSIIQDDPLKMHRLADIFHIDISQIHEMWVVSGDEHTAELLREQSRVFCGYLKSCSDIVFSDVYEGKLLIFSSTPYSEREALQQVESFLTEISSLGLSATLSRFSDLQNTTEVREAFLKNNQYLEDARRIFPTRRWFSGGDIRFAGECRDLIARGEDFIAPYTLILNRLAAATEDWDAVATAGAYMLDTGCSITQTAALLHVHKNTVKYRLSVIDNRLGYNHNKMPDNIRLYYAIALHRLLN